MTLTWVSTTPRRSDNLQSSDYVFSSSALLKRGLDISEFFLCWSSEFSTLSCFWGHSNFLFLTILCLPCPTLWWWWCLKDLCGVSDGDTDSPSSNLSVRESHCHTPLCRRIIPTGPAAGSNDMFPTTPSSFIRQGWQCRRRCHRGPRSSESFGTLLSRRTMTWRLYALQPGCCPEAPYGSCRVWR